MIRPAVALPISADHVAFLSEQRFLPAGKAVPLGAHPHEDIDASRFAGMTPAERAGAAPLLGEKIHPRHQHEFSAGAALAWNRVP